MQPPDSNLRSGNRDRPGAEAAHCSSGSFFSSIAMSFNSLDSKTSPHSWHSTYSDSSSRETICTRGCLHCSGATFFWADCDGWLSVINFVDCSTLERKWAFSPNFRYFAATGQGCQVPRVPLSYHIRNVPVLTTIEMSARLWFHAAPEKRARALLVWASPRLCLITFLTPCQPDPCPRFASGVVACSTFLRASGFLCSSPALN